MRKKIEEPRFSENKKCNMVLFAILGINTVQCICQLAIICKAKQCKNTPIFTESNVEHDIDSPAQRGSFAEDFKTIFLLIISLLHGTLFFFLCENAINV